jgi:hypothetical protein
MIRLSCKVPNARRVAGRLRSAGRKAPVITKRILEWGADMVANKAKENLGKAAKSGTGIAAGGIWAGRAKGRDNPKVETGWSHYYPRVLEWGPANAANRRGWEIKPRTAKMLRFMSKGKVVYAKRVWHPWDAGQKRPHFEDAVNEVWPRVIAKLGGVAREALK